MESNSTIYFCVITPQLFSDVCQSGIVRMKPRPQSFLTVLIHKELWEVEELRDELFHVRWALHTSLPCCCYWVELSVCAIKPANTPQTNTQRQKRNASGGLKKWMLQNGLFIGIHVQPHMNICISCTHCDWSYIVKY